jgi:hypothetical protein
VSLDKVQITVADTGSRRSDEYFPRARFGDLNLFDGEGLPHFTQYSSLHVFIPD